jgi:hypothetical protein
MSPGQIRTPQAGLPGQEYKPPAHYRHTKQTGEPMAGLSRFPNRLARSYLHSRDGRIRTGDPLNPIQWSTYYHVLALPSS